MRADYLVSAGSFYLAPGYSSETMEIYVAKGLSSAPLPRDIDEDIIVHKIPFKKLLKQVCAGDFSDIKTVTAILLVTLKKELYKPSEME
jgi:ADP-ribose pyrophosphatase